MCFATIGQPFLLRAAATLYEEVMKLNILSTFFLNPVMQILQENNKWCMPEIYF